MSEIRRRKVGAQNGVKEKSQKSEVVDSSKSTDQHFSWVLVGEVVIALSIAFLVGYKYALYAKELHENDMWFSNIGVSKNRGILLQ